ncbi:hypothetical protein AKO1_005187, partial [Acrasis kona]
IEVATMSQKDTHKQKTYVVEALMPDVSSIVKGWMGDTEFKENNADEESLKKFFEQSDPRKRRAGVNAHQLAEAGVKNQLKHKNDKINSDLKYALLNKHDAKKRKKRKGMLIDYGEDEENQEESDSENKPDVAEPASKKRKNNTKVVPEDEEEEGKSAKFTKKLGNNRATAQKANNLIQHYTSNKPNEQLVNKKKKKKSKKKQKTI